MIIYFCLLQTRKAIRLWTLVCREEDLANHNQQHGGKLSDIKLIIIVSDFIIIGFTFSNETLRHACVRSAKASVVEPQSAVYSIISLTPIRVTKDSKARSIRLGYIL